MVPGEQTLGLSRKEDCGALGKAKFRKRLSSSGFSLWQEPCLGCFQPKNGAEGSNTSSVPDTENQPVKAEPLWLEQPGKVEGGPAVPPLPLPARSPARNTPL